MNSVKLVAALLLATVLVVFGVQNTQAVTFHFLIFKAPSVPMVVALFVAAILGALLGWIVSAPSRLRRMRERHALRGQVQAQEREAASAAERSQPH